MLTLGDLEAFVACLPFSGADHRALTCTGADCNSHKGVALLLFALGLQAGCAPDVHTQQALHKLLEVVRIHVDGLRATGVQLLQHMTL